ncbi:unnamed protein product [Staurois parvus]|uniref:Uncharacterized protein n=1 Tax=Staurois parvus TaxID=386267 RepID=A0ABN9H4F9_9NEOB|nr:unnamed protein product [Staurois parvus]
MASRNTPKTCFTILIPEVETELQSFPERRSIILCSIERQASITRTTLDLLETGFAVHVVADAHLAVRFTDLWLLTALSKVELF